VTLFVLLVAASALSTALRFLLMPAWIFRKVERFSSRGKISSHGG
jgi:flagellar biogenesis protein FliO